MRTVFLLIINVFITVSLLAQTNQGPDNIAQTVDRLFSAVDNANPTHHTKNQEWRGYNIKLQEYVGSEFYDDRGLFYSLSYFDFPEEVAKDASDEELLDMFLEGGNDEDAIAKLPGVIQKTRTFEQNGMTIREYHAIVPDAKRSVDVRAIIKGRRLYMLQVLSPETSPHPSVEQFYKAFRLEN